MTIGPNAYSHVGTHTITITATDPIGFSVSGILNIFVRNMPPVFTNSAPTVVETDFLVDYTYILPSFADPEG
jgi:hypothetical protein